MKTLLPFIILVFAFTAFGQNQKYKAVVKVVVNHDSDKVEQRFEEAIKSALLKFNDEDTELSIVSKDAEKWDYKISVLITDSMVSGNHYGYAAAVFYLETEKCINQRLKTVDKNYIYDCNVEAATLSMIFPTDSISKESNDIAEYFKRVYGLKWLLFQNDLILSKPNRVKTQKKKQGNKL